MPVSARGSPGSVTGLAAAARCAHVVPLFHGLSIILAWSTNSTFGFLEFSEILFKYLQSIAGWYGLRTPSYRGLTIQSRKESGYPWHSLSSLPIPKGESNPYHVPSPSPAGVTKESLVLVPKKLVLFSATHMEKYRVSTHETAMLFKHFNYKPQQQGYRNIYTIIIMEN